MDLHENIREKETARGENMSQNGLNSEHQIFDEK